MPTPERQPNNITEVLIGIGGSNYLEWQQLETTGAPDGFVSVPTAAMRQAILDAPEGNIYFRLQQRNFEGIEPRNAPYDFASGLIVVDFDSREVTIDQKPVYFTRREFALLHYLGSNAGKVLGRDEILAHVWGPGYSIATLQAHMSFLWAKLGPELGDKEKGALRSIRGVGILAVK